MILHIPHSSTVIPSGIISINKDELQEELFHSTDWFTNELFDYESCIRKMVFPYSRLYIDVERFEDSKEDMFLVGRGIVYEKTLDGKSFKTNLNYSRSEYYKWHAELKKTIEESTSLFNKLCIVDCHSFGEKIIGNLEKPDFCLGYNPDRNNYLDIEVISKAKKFLESKGYLVSINSPYGGSMIPEEYYKSDIGSIMIEVNRNLYMQNENNKAVKSERFSEIKNVIHSLLETIDTIVS